MASRDLGSDASGSGSVIDLDELHVEMGFHLSEWPGYIDCDSYLSSFGPPTVDRLLDLARFGEKAAVALVNIATMGYAGAPDIEMRKIARAALADTPFSAEQTVSPGPGCNITPSSPHDER